MQVVYEKSKSYIRPHPFCAGCMYGLVTKLILDTLDELEIDPLKTVYFCPPGCACQVDASMNFNSMVPGLGRSAATASGIKRVSPETFLLCFDGDGSDAAIGIGDVIHAAGRGENITVIMVNNSLFANTGGQMAPTTLIGQKSTTCKDGRKPERDGYPINMAEIVASAPGCKFSARVSCYDPAHIRQAKAAVKKAFLVQKEAKGFGFVEFLSNCPTNWHMTAQESLEHIRNVSEKQYPLGIFKEEA